MDASFRNRDFGVLPSLPVNRNWVAVIDAKTCAFDYLSFNEWRFGLLSYCMLNLGETVGPVHWMGLRCSFSLQGLRHHLIAQQFSALFRDLTQYHSDALIDLGSLK